MLSSDRRQFLKQAAALGVVGYMWRPLRAAPALVEPSADQTFTIEDMWRWRLEVRGEVREPLLLGLHDLRALPSRFATLRLTSPSGGTSVASWEGIHLSTFERFAQPESDARYVHIHCVDGHQDCFTVADLSRPQALFAHTRQGLMLGPEHGGPLRLVIPWRLTSRCPVAIDRIEFRREPLENCEPLSDHVPLFSRDDYSWEESASRAWSDQARSVEIWSQHPRQASGGPWGPVANPVSPADTSELKEYASHLDAPSFYLTNQHRTHLIQLGEAGLTTIPDRVFRAVQTDARLYAHNVAAEVPGALSDQNLIRGLVDASPEVAALCLDALIRRGKREGFERALQSINHPHAGIALTAIAAAGVLPAEQDRSTWDLMLRVERSAAGDPTRVDLLDRVQSAQSHLPVPASPEIIAAGI